jgi:hypothetical protein
MKNILAPFNKAIAGIIGTIGVSLGTAMSDGDLTRAEIIVAVGAGLVIGGGLVYAVPNKTE